MRLAAPNEAINSERTEGELSHSREVDLAADFDDDSPPSSSAVREAALVRHADVRRELSRGIAAVRAMRAGEADGPQRIRAAIQGIASAVRKQIRADDLELAPILETLDAWGPQRVELLESAHAEERSAVAQVLETDAKVAQRAALLETSIRAILQALRVSEKELLDPDLLDESTIVNPWQGGS